MKTLDAAVRIPARIQDELHTKLHLLHPALDHTARIISGGETLMNVSKAAVKLPVFIRRRRAARPKRTLADWVALTIARLMTFAVISGLVYVTYIVEMAGYDDFRKCNKNSTLTKVEWVLGFRPAEDCRSF